MGTDIHPVVEVRIDGKWTAMKPAKPRYEGWEDDPPMLFVRDFDRQYDSFAVMANVRNGFGFGGCDTGDEAVAISEPRGLPDDRDIKDDVYGDHSFSWLTLKEILDYGWDKKKTKRGFVPREVALELALTNKAPESWCGWTNAPDHVQYEWEWPLRKCCGVLLAFVEEVRAEFPDRLPEDIRLVFGFDS